MSYYCRGSKYVSILHRRGIGKADKTSNIVYGNDRGIVMCPNIQFIYSSLPSDKLSDEKIRLT
jgi:hypothetical protein